MENQVKLNAERIELLNKFKEAAPQFMAAEAQVIEIAYKELWRSDLLKSMKSL